MSDSPSSLRRILALARPEAAPIALGTVFLLISSSLNLAYPLLIGRLVDAVTGGGGRAAVDRMALTLLGLFALVSAATAMRAWLFSVAGERVVARLRKRLFAALIHQEIGFFDASRTGELTSRLASDTSVLQNAVTVNISMGLRYTLSALGAIGILMWQSWKLTLLMLAVVPFAASTAIAEEGLAGVRTVRAFAREGHEVERYGAAVEQSFSLARRRAFLGAGFQGFIGFFGYAAIAAVLWYGGVLLLDGTMTFGDLTSFMLYTFTVAFSIGALSGLWEDFAKALGASGRVFELLDRQPAVAGGAERLPAVKGHVRLEGVRFAYPTRPEVEVLQGLTLDLRPGEVVALVGHSGGGKSTVAALLSRFYDPVAGRITLDDRPLTDLEPDWLRQQVGVVSQEPILFATTIRDNIRYGRPTASDAEVEAAARAANAHDFVASFPAGYDTLVGERGVRLSGGQKQRVAIARAILKDPRVLVLDEATSALDAESEHLVQEALERLMEGRSTLVIAHRLSTVKDADRVVVLDGGKVVQEGSHEALLAQEGLYRRLVERQFAA